MQVDELYLGPLGVDFQKRSAVAQGSSPTPFGLGPLGRVIVYDLNPAALSATAICAAQAIAGAANAVINGGLATAGVATLAEQFGRALSMVSSNVGDTTQTVTITGTDFLGNTQSQVKTLNGTTTVNFTKCWKTVTQVAVSAVMTGNLTVGNRDAFGLPVYVSDAGYIAFVKYNNTLAQDAGTLTVGDTTNPATTATTDTRGFYAPSGAAGSKRLVIGIVLQDIHVGYSAIGYSVSGGATGAFGVTPV